MLRGDKRLVINSRAGKCNDLHVHVGDRTAVCQRVMDVYVQAGGLVSVVKG